MGEYVEPGAGVTVDGAGLRIAVVAGRFNDHVTRPLLEGALATLDALGVEDPRVFWVPGAFEMPVLTQRLAATGGFDAVVCLGVVIRGGTPHFEYVAGTCAEGIQRVALDTGVPIAFGVLTTDDLAQAEARAGGTEGNKGEEAARTAVEMACLLRAVAGSQA